MKIYYTLFATCDDCKEPIPIDCCQRLGFNPGVDGHMWKTKEDAMEILRMLRTDYPDYFTKNTKVGEIALNLFEE